MQFTKIAFAFLGLLASALAAVVPDQYIVVLKDGTNLDTFLAKLPEGTETVHRWEFMLGAVVKSPKLSVESLSAYPEVQSAEPDSVISVEPCSEGPCRKRSVSDAYEEAERSF